MSLSAKSALQLTTAAALLATQAGCAAQIMSGTLPGITNNWLLPAVIESGDVDQGCASGEALGALVVAFADLKEGAKRASIVPAMSAGMCVEENVREAQLARNTALYEGSAHRAKDARTVEKRSHYLAALRYKTAFDTLTTTYGTPDIGEECPKLKKEADQLTYLLGLSSGVLALLHNTAADNSAGVSMRAAGQVVRGAACLDDDQWWGVPKALQSAVWALMPGAPEDADPWGTFDASVTKGEAAGVRLASAFYVQSAATAGRDALLRDAIQRHATAITSTPADPTWSMLDNYATELVTHESDRLWTRENGYRTPFGDLGTFPGVTAPPTESDDDGLFDDVFGD